jgi:hypothetical protein
VVAPCPSIGLDVRSWIYYSAHVVVPSAAPELVTPVPHFFGNSSGMKQMSATRVNAPKVELLTPIPRACNVIASTRRRYEWNEELRTV